MSKELSIVVIGPLFSADKFCDFCVAFH